MAPALPTLAGGTDVGQDISPTGRAATVTPSEGSDEDAPRAREAHGEAPSTPRPAAGDEQDDPSPPPPRAGVGALVRGAIAGLVATVAMTVAMEWMFRRLPQPQRLVPLPPRLLVVKTAARTGAISKMDQQARDRATMLAHFAFGASAGSLFPALAVRAPLPSPLVGVLYGVVVYLSSYAGWVPALRLYPAPHEDTTHRTALMFAAHLVWGSTLGIVEAQARRVRRTG